MSKLEAKLAPTSKECWAGLELVCVCGGIVVQLPQPHSLRVRHMLHGIGGNASPSIWEEQNGRAWPMWEWNWLLLGQTCP